MSPAEIDPNWPTLAADDEQMSGWAQYIAYWLQAQTPAAFRPAQTPEPTAVSYDDAPWATTCLQDLFNA